MDSYQVENSQVTGSYSRPVYQQLLQLPSDLSSPIVLFVGHWSV